MQSKQLVVFAALVCLSLESSTFAAPPEYRLKVLPLHPLQNEAAAYSINESGEVVGYVQLTGANGRPHPYVYDLETGAITYLNRLAGGTGIAYDINESGLVTGWINSRPFVYDGAALTFLDINALGFHSGTGLSINDHGQVTGSMDAPPGPVLFVGFSSDGVDVESLGTLGGAWSSANAINNSGVIVGSSQPKSGGNPHAFRLENDVMEDIGDLSVPTATSAAIDVNESGLIVGYASRDARGGIEAATIQDGMVTFLGTLAGNAAQRGADALGVNDFGAIVGRSGTADLPNGFSHAFIYLDDTMYDLNDYLRTTGDFYIDEAWEINNLGQIAGRARLGNGEYRAVILTPVPEPTAFVLATIGALALAARRSRAGEKAKKCRVQSDE